MSEGVGNGFVRCWHKVIWPENRLKAAKNGNRGPAFRRVGAVRLGMGSLSLKDVHAFEVVGQANERPLPGGSTQAP